MGKSTTTTTSSGSQTSQLFASPQGQLESFLEGMTPGLISQLMGTADSAGMVARQGGGLAGRLSPLLSSLARDFQGLPSALTASQFLMGGATPEQRMLLDRRARESTQGARMSFQGGLRDVFSQAGQGALGAGVSTGLGGSFQGVPYQEAARIGARGYGELAGQEANIRAGLGTQYGGGILSAQQAAMGNLLGIGNQLLGAQGSQLAALQGRAGIIGGAGDMAFRQQALQNNYRLATGRQTGSSFGRQEQVTPSPWQTDPFGQLLNLGVGAGLMFGSGGFFPMGGGGK